MIQFDDPPGERRPWSMVASPCKACGGIEGYIAPKSGQNCLYCSACGTFIKNVAKADTGEKPRPISPRKDIKVSQRFEILERDSFRCVLCGNSRDAGVILHVSHIISVDEGSSMEPKLSTEELNHSENLITLCEACNSGQRNQSLSPRVYFRLAILLKLAVARDKRGSS